jgi:hypothetical protein
MVSEMIPKMTLTYLQYPSTVLSRLSMSLLQKRHQVVTCVTRRRTPTINAELPDLRNQVDGFQASGSAPAGLLDRPCHKSNNE